MRFVSRFAVTIVLPGIIALVLFLTVCVLKYSSVEYLDKISNRQIISTPFYCDFWVCNVIHSTNLPVFLQAVSNPVSFHCYD